MAPIVDGLAEQYRGKVSVSRIDANGGADVARTMNIRVFPTYVFLDSSGEVIERLEGGNSQKLDEGFKKAAGEWGG